MVILLISLIFAIGCAPKIPSEKEAQAETEEDFGCSPPPTCAMMKDSFTRQFCEDWKAGKDVWSTIPDCSFMTTEGCKKLCEEKTKGRTNQMPSMPSGQMPSGMPSMGDFPNPSDYPNMDEMMKSMMQKGIPNMPAGQTPPAMPSPDGMNPGAQSGSFSLFPSKQPVCVNADDYHAQLIYARTSNAKDRYEEKAPILRKWLANGNGIVNNEAQKFGVNANLKVACKNGEASVLNVVLKESSGSALSLGTFVNELKSLGYTDSKTKYIVWYDGTVVGCSGSSTGKCTSTISTKPSDDRLVEDNAYNTGGEFAMIFGIEDEISGPA